MADQIESHYVANLTIERVDKTRPDTSGRPPSYSTNPPPLSVEKRDVVEVTRLVIKGEDLQNLLSKLGKHIALVEDDT